MEIKELIEALRYQPGNMAFSPQIRLKVADRFEELLAENKQLRNDLIMQTALAQNGQSILETNKQLMKKYQALSEDFKEVILKFDNTCKYCKYHQPCNGKNCDCYIEGEDVWDNKNRHYDWQWTCMDFNFGECPKLENTPCNGCIKNNMRGFEWRGENGCFGLK